MAEQRNKVVIDLKVNSDVTKQLKEIRKTSQASFAENQQGQQKAAKSFWDMFSEWAKDTADLVKEYITEFLKGQKKSVQDYLNRNAKMAKKLGKINKAAKGGDPYDHFAKAWADEEKSRRGVNGPFYVDEVMADAKVMGQEKNIGKYFKKNTRMPSTTEPMDPTATATCLSK